MTIKPFRRIATSIPDLAKTQDSMVELVSTLLRLELLGYTILKDISVSTSDTIIAHNLNRVPNGFMLIKSNGDVRVWESTTTNITADKLLILRASSSATVSLLVF